MARIVREQIVSRRDAAPLKSELTKSIKIDSTNFSISHSFHSVLQGIPGKFFTISHVVARVFTLHRPIR